MQDCSIWTCRFAIDQSHCSELLLRIFQMVKMRACIANSKSLSASILYWQTFEFKISKAFCHHYWKSMQLNHNTILLANQISSNTTLMSYFILHGTSLIVEFSHIKDSSVAKLTYTWQPHVYNSCHSQCWPSQVVLAHNFMYTYAKYESTLQKHLITCSPISKA